MPDNETPLPSSSKSAPRASTSALPQKAPRPPNPWILYRSERAKNLPRGPGGMQQSDVSKVIADAWANETADVREHYQHLAEQKKAEHALRYPKYRFRPTSKFEKLLMSEKKRVQREASRDPSRRTRTSPSSRFSPYAGSEHASMSATTRPGPPNSVPLPPFPPAAAYHQIQGSLGPSPPMSAASSPASVNEDLPGTLTAADQEAEPRVTSIATVDSQEPLASSADLAIPSVDDFSFSSIKLEPTAMSALAASNVQEWDFSSGNDLSVCSCLDLTRRSDVYPFHLELCDVQCPRVCHSRRRQLGHSRRRHLGHPSPSLRWRLECPPRS